MESTSKKIFKKFIKHKLGLVGLCILAVLYVLIIFAGFFSPYAFDKTNQVYANAPPSKIHIIDAEGKWHFPFIYQMEKKRNPVTYLLEFTENTAVRYPIRLFHKGDPYKIFGFIPADIHLFGIDAEPQDALLLLFGADRFGRDMFTRTLTGGQVSMSVGLIGTFITVLIGAIIGAFSGYYGGWVDTMIQRFIELLRSFPRIPLWLAFAVILPPTWPSTAVYFGMIIVLSLIGWMGVARVVRGMVLSLREKDFVQAAKVSGVSGFKIITRHLIPNTMSYLIVATTLSIPGMILGESTISFLGLGIKEPMTSWGLLLKQAQSFAALESTPWLIIPGFFIMIAVLSFNFVGDALRDAVDPYKKMDKV